MEVEGHSDAWHRVYWILKAMNWPGENACPIRLRGYSELVMSRIDPKTRKKIDSAIKRGYKLDKKGDFTKLLGMICEFNPIEQLKLGYVGKTRMNIYLPTHDDAVDLQRELQAQTVMTEALAGREIRVQGKEVFVLQEHKAGGMGSKDQPQLKGCLSALRIAIDEWLTTDAAIRESVAAWCALDESVIRIPFDTHQEE